MEHWRTVPDGNVSILDTWEYIVKPDVRRITRDRQCEVQVERFGTLNALFTKLSFFSSELQSGDLSVMADLRSAQLEIDDHYRIESEKILTFARTYQIETSEKAHIYAYKRSRQ